MNVNDEIILNTDCPATLIPAGDKVTLEVGSIVFITQALGGTVTVRKDGGLYQISSENLGALDVEIESLSDFQNNHEIRSGREFGVEDIWEALKNCFDPEIPVNIVDLGLIYDLQIEPRDDGKHDVKVKMTLTAQGCGMGPTIAADAKTKILSIPEIADADVQIVWDPQWTPHMISDVGRKVLGLD